MQLTPLFSGSSGNCLLAEDGSTKFLIDAGLPGNRITQALSRTGTDISEIKAIIISHEHTDHTAGAGVLSRKLRCPVYSNRQTYDAMAPFIGNIRDEHIVHFENDKPFFIDGLSITAFPVSHDAADPVGFTVTDGKKKLGIATDFGEITQCILDHLLGSDSAYIESNHDIRMLNEGSYPFSLKQRISGCLGHLSNTDSARLCTELIAAGTKRITLGHLSLENNTPQTAFETAERIIREAGMKIRIDYLLDVAKRSDVSDILYVK